MLGSGVDTAIQRLGRSYNVRGLTDQVTSYSDVAGTNVANQVQYLYNDFGQLTVEYQQHSGAVNTSSSPKVQYSYASGSNNTVRPTSVTYPSLNGLSGRVLSLNYSSTDDDALSRVSSLSDGGGTLVNYTYLGLGSFVQSNAPEPNLTWTLISGSGANPYTGLDRFGRVIDCRWTNASGDVERLQYGYNRDSSRQWRKENLTTLNDELYTYDNLQRLITMQRGNLALTPLLSGEGGPSGPGEGLSPMLTSPTLQQSWTLDATGNWPGFSNSESGNTFNQTRTSNAANEITAIAQTTSPPPSNWATPAYNAVGNMTSMPSSSSLIPPTSSLSATYDAWNRLTSLGSSATFRYDALNRRIQKTISGTTSDAYYNSSWQLLAELTGSAQQQFVWGLRYIDDGLLRDRYNGTFFVDRIYPFQDANWNVTGLVSTSGTVLERYRYTAYGQPTFLNASFTPITFGGGYAWTTLYCGYRWDRESGLYYVRYRYYHPLLGCWLTRDPIKSDHNPHRYCVNNPLMYLDPSGRGIPLAIPIIVGGITAYEAAQAVAAFFGLSLLACMADRACSEAMFRAIDEALKGLSDTAKEVLQKWCKIQYSVYKTSESLCRACKPQRAPCFWDRYTRCLDAQLQSACWANVVVQRSAYILNGCDFVLIPNWQSHIGDVLLKLNTLNNCATSIKNNCGLDF